MQKYFAAATFVLLVAAVVVRAQVRRRQGVKADAVKIEEKHLRPSESNEQQMDSELPL